MHAEQKKRIKAFHIMISLIRTLTEPAKDLTGVFFYIGDTQITSGNIPVLPVKPFGILGMLASWVAPITGRPADLVLLF